MSGVGERCCVYVTLGVCCLGVLVRRAKRDEIRPVRHISVFYKAGNVVANFSWSRFLIPTFNFLIKQIILFVGGWVKVLFIFLNVDLNLLNLPQLDPWIFNEPGHSSTSNMSSNSTSDPFKEILLAQKAVGNLPLQVVQYVNRLS